MRQEGARRPRPACNHHLNVSSWAGGGCFCVLRVVTPPRLGPPACGRRWVARALGGGDASQPRCARRPQDSVRAALFVLHQRWEQFRRLRVCTVAHLALPHLGCAQGRDGAD
eukprot:9503195-Pyramimonas_sp.AAC.4